MNQPGRRSRFDWRLKYVAEWAVALAACILLIPLGLVLALLVKITSRGPVFYLSERLGANGQTFILYKYRTMKANVDQLVDADGKVVTVANDPRFTVIGRFLRLGFDEMPQLLNVLKGEMCIIGPRPDVVWQNKLYDPRERLRLMVLPGITGLTQVLNGRELTNAENYELDVRYLESSSWRTDLLILFLTLPYAFGMRQIGRRFLSPYLRDISDTNTESNVRQ